MTSEYQFASACSEQDAQSPSWRWLGPVTGRFGLSQPFGLTADPCPDRFSTSPSQHLGHFCSLRSDRHPSAGHVGGALLRGPLRARRSSRKLRHTCQFWKLKGRQMPKKVSMFGWFGCQLLPLFAPIGSTHMDAQQKSQKHLFVEDGRL